MSSTNINGVGILANWAIDITHEDTIEDMPTRRDSFGRRLLHLRRDTQLTQLEVLDRLRDYGVTVNQSRYNPLIGNANPV